MNDSRAKLQVFTNFQSYCRSSSDKLRLAWVRTVRQAKPQGVRLPPGRFPQGFGGFGGSARPSRYNTSCTGEGSPSQALERVLRLQSRQFKIRSHCFGICLEFAYGYISVFSTMQHRSRMRRFWPGQRTGATLCSKVRLQIPPLHCPDQFGGPKT